MIARPRRGWFAFLPADSSLSFKLLLTIVIIDAAARTLYGYLQISHTAELPQQNSLMVLTFAVFALVCTARPIALVLGRHPTPLSQLRKDVVDNRWWLVSSIVLFFFLPDSFDVATKFKKMIPQVVPFYADPFLANIDHSVLGTDAWRLTHAVLGNQATYIVSGFYTSWLVLHFVLLLVIVLDRTSPLKFRAALSFQLTWLLLGAAMAMALSSVGPCFYHQFYGDARFVPLLDSLPDDLRQRKAMAYLLSTRGTDAIGSGMSAMPSLHVATSVLGALYTQARFRNRWVAACVWAYAAIIYVGSVHIGWHYASDGIVGALAVTLIWLAAGKFADRMTGARGSSAEAGIRE
jgi:hypothetical protein